MRRVTVNKQNQSKSSLHVIFGPMTPLWKWHGVRILLRDESGVVRVCVCVCAVYSISLDKWQRNSAGMYFYKQGKKLTKKETEDHFQSTPLSRKPAEVVNQLTPIKHVLRTHTLRTHTHTHTHTDSWPPHHPLNPVNVFTTRSVTESAGHWAVYIRLTMLASGTPHGRLSQPECSHKHTN